MASIFKNPGQWLEDTTNSFNRSDVGKFTSASADAMWGTIVAPVRLTASIWEGDFEKEFQRAVGNTHQTLNPVSTLVASNKGIQRVLENKTLDTLTGGLSADFAGYSRGFGTMANEGKLANSDRDDIFRLGGKVGALVGGAYAASAYAAPAASATPTLGAGVYPGGAYPVLAEFGATPVATSTGGAGFWSSLWGGAKAIGSGAMSAVTGLTSFIGGVTGLANALGLNRGSHISETAYIGSGGGQQDPGMGLMPIMVPGQTQVGMPSMGMDSAAPLLLYAGIGILLFFTVKKVF